MKWNKNNIGNWKTTIALLFAAIAICLLHMYAPPGIMEAVYGQSVFPVIRKIQNGLFSWLPFSAILILLIGLIFIIVRFFRRTIRKKDWVNILKVIISVLSIVYISFYILWGFNYDRPDLQSRLNWETERISADDFLDFARSRVDSLNRLRIRLDTTAFNYKEVAKELAISASRVAREYGYAFSKNVPSRQLSPKGILMRFSTAGFYFPFTGECNIDAGLHKLEKPSVMAHEIFHGLGVSGEGDCNFLAYWVCQDSQSDFVRYSGELDLWYYLMRDLRQVSPEYLDSLRSTLSEEVVADFESIRANNRKYPDIMPATRDAIYNAYLKSNEISTGIHDYNRITQMVLQAYILGHL